MTTLLLLFSYEQKTIFDVVKTVFSRALGEAAVQTFMTTMADIIDEQKQKSPTGKLWINYVKQINQRHQNVYSNLCHAGAKVLVERPVDSGSLHYTAPLCAATVSVEQIL